MTMTRATHPRVRTCSADLFDARDAEAADDARNAGENAMAELAEQAVRTALDFGSPQMRAVMVARLTRLLPELEPQRAMIDASVDEKIVVTSGLRLLTDIAKRQKTEASRRSILAVRAVVERWFKAATEPA